MLQEILLSLFGHPSPLLAADNTSASSSSSASIFSPPEKALLASIAHLSTLHQKLLAGTAAISASHQSSICQAVATAISATHLARFQQKIIDVEDAILRRDAGSVGAYSIVPLTAIVGEFAGWTRRMEWFLDVVEYILRAGAGGGGERKCTGAMLIDRLRAAMQTGYMDIAEAALSLVRVAETAWLRQVSAWILYGRLPSFGRGDFFVHEVVVEGPEYECRKELLPAFVTASTASSLLFIGRSLNHIRVKGASSTTSMEMDLLSSHLKQLSALTFPLSSANFSRVIASIRLSLSQTALQKLLPLSKVVEIMSLLREFFLLGRGEFAVALITEADEKMRSRWRRSENAGYGKQSGMGSIVVKDGEISSALARTWAAMGSLQSSDEDQEEDELLELARDLVQLTLSKPAPTSASKVPQIPSSKIASTPFKNLLFSVPVSLVLHIPSPLDLFLTPTDIQTYSSINAYLLSIHRAHIRLTDLWKVTALRRQHPAPPVANSTFAKTKVKILRERGRMRSEAMRSVWATSSAAVFFLGETQAYLQGEVVQGTWDGFKSWLVGQNPPSGGPAAASDNDDNDDDDDDDIWLQAGKEETTTQTKPYTHDPQTLALAHNTYLTILTSSLLLSHSSFTQSLFTLLQQIDHLVALVHRIHAIWSSLDLEADEGVVDAFSDFHKEEADVLQQLGAVSGRVKGAIETCIKVLRGLDADVGAGMEKDGGGAVEEVSLEEEDVAYVPARVGRVDRLLMKLDFGGWFDLKGDGENDAEGGSFDDDDDL